MSILTIVLLVVTIVTGDLDWLWLVAASIVLAFLVGPARR